MRLTKPHVSGHRRRADELAAAAAVPTGENRLLGRSESIGGGV